MQSIGYGYVLAIYEVAKYMVNKSKFMHINNEINL
jgi:hypothetical protein